MKIKKKAAAVITLSVAFATASLSGCSTQATGSNNQGTSGKIELEFFTQKPEAVETFDKIVKAFNESQDEIVVTQNIVPDANTVLMSRASTDDLPDVIQVGGMQDANTMQFMKEGQFMDLSGMECINQVVDHYKDSIKYQGKNYVVPISANFSGVFYDIDQFKEAGYEIPQTYEELIQIAEDIQSKGNIAFLFPDKDAWTLVQFWEDNIDGSNRGARKEIYDGVISGQTTFQDDPYSVEALEKIVELHKYGQKDTLALGYDQAISDFATGKAYMFTQGIWALPSIKKANPNKNIGMFSIPTNNGTDTKVSMGIDVNLAISAKTEKVEAAKKFVEFVASKESVQIYVDNDYSIPCVKGAQAKIPEAENIVARIDRGAGVLQTISIPKAVADWRPNNIQKLILPTEAPDIASFLADYTKVFADNKAEYEEMYGE